MGATTRFWTNTQKGSSFVTLDKRSFSSCVFWVGLVAGGYVYVAGFKDERVLDPVDADPPLRSQVAFPTIGLFALEPIAVAGHRFLTDTAPHTGSERYHVSGHTEGDQ